MGDLVATRFKLIAAKAELMADQGERAWATDIKAAVREIQEQLNAILKVANDREWGGGER